MGARIFEKHVALANQTKGFDVKFSLKGKQLLSFKKELLKTQNFRKKDFYRNKNELKNLKFRRSIYAIKNIKKNEKFSEKNIKTIRPASGLNPKFYFKILNRKSKKY